jgi:hypothetical protein
MTPLPAAVAVTGNVLIDSTALPPRPGTLPSGLTDWDVLNTVFPYAVPPTLTGISPTSGPAAGGTPVIINGSGFTGVTGVTFNQTAAAFTVNSDSQITATSPAGSGTVTITVTTPAGSDTAQFTYTGAAPTITGIVPRTGTSGTPVHISGSGFIETTSVTFTSPNASPASAAFSVHPDGRTIDTASPPGSGAAIITVTTPFGQATGQFSYVAAPPQIQGITPAGGPMGGGTPITINGRGFTGVSAVTFTPQGGSPVPVSFNFINDHEITVTAPPGSGVTTITVTTPAGSATAQFTYSGPPPHIDVLQPNSMGVDEVGNVAIRGSGFTGATDVSFGDVVPDSFSVSSDALIVASLSGASKAETVHVTVTTPAGTSNPVPFTFTGTIH